MSPDGRDWQDAHGEDAVLIVEPDIDRRGRAPSKLSSWTPMENSPSIAEERVALVADAAHECAEIDVSGRSAIGLEHGVARAAIKLGGRRRGKNGGRGLMPSGQQCQCAFHFHKVPNISPPIATQGGASAQSRRVTSYDFFARAAATTSRTASTTACGACQRWM